MVPTGRAETARRLIGLDACAAARAESARVLGLRWPEGHPTMVMLGGALARAHKEPVAVCAGRTRQELSE